MVEKKAKTARRASASAAKKEMLETYNEAVAELEARRAEDMQPEEKIAEKAQQAAIVLADELTTDNVAKGIATLKSEVIKTLNLVGDKLDAEASKYSDLKRAITTKEKELQDIYEIGKQASSLAALIDSQHQKRDEFEADMAARKQQLDEEILNARVEWEEEKKKNEQEKKERDAADQKKREREREEYEYQFKREQQLRREQFEDEKTRMERDLQVKKAQSETAFSEREKALAQRENELVELRRRAEAAPKELETAVARAVKETGERLQQEARSREELARRESDGERNVLMARIEALEKTVKEQNAQTAKLSQQLEKAYSQVQDIAVKTVEGSAASKSLSRLEQIVGEQARKPTQEK